MNISRQNEDINIKRDNTNCIAELTALLTSSYERICAVLWLFLFIKVPPEDTISPELVEDLCAGQLRQCYCQFPGGFFTGIDDRRDVTLKEESLFYHNFIMYYWTIDRNIEKWLQVIYVRNVHCHELKARLMCALLVYLILNETCGQQLFALSAPETMEGLLDRLKNWLPRLYQVVEREVNQRPNKRTLSAIRLRLHNVKKICLEIDKAADDIEILNKCSNYNCSNSIEGITVLFLCSHAFCSPCSVVANFSSTCPCLPAVDAKPCGASRFEHLDSHRVSGNIATFARMWRLLKQTKAELEEEEKDLEKDMEEDAKEDRTHYRKQD